MRSKVRSERPHRLGSDAPLVVLSAAMSATGVEVVPTGKSTEDLGSPSRPSSFLRLLKARIIAFLVFFCLIWPLLANLFAFLALKAEPLFLGIPLWVVGLALAVGTLDMAFEMAFCGVLMAIVSLLPASALGGPVSSVRSSGRRRLVVFIEPALIAWGFSCGIALEYPGLLAHPMFGAFKWNTVVWASLLAIGAGITAAALFGRWTGVRCLVWRYPAVLVTALLFGWITALPVQPSAAEAGTDTTVILGLDSISQVDEVGQLRDLAVRHGGTWYERPVTPGLLTNPVWTSILAGRTVGETGIFFVYQLPDWSRMPDNLVKRAHSQGYTTFSYLSDQFTTHVGSMAGFQHDRSGPIGWKQEATVFLKNGHIFVAVLLPRLPRLPGSATPANQSGTFTYSFRDELTEVLCAGGDRSGKSLVAAHSDYLHQPRYPAYSDLTAEERNKVFGAPAGALVDRSLDWQYPVEWGEPLGLYRWKLRHLQETVAACIRQTRFLEQGKRNKLIVFSDHGSRTGVLAHNFGEEKYHRVVLIGFNTEKRDPSSPISLVDIPALIGLPDPHRPQPADPVVQYVNVDASEWNLLLQDSRPAKDGAIWLDRKVVDRLALRLRGYRPYSTSGYFPVPISGNYERKQR